MLCAVSEPLAPWVRDTAILFASRATYAAYLHEFRAIGWRVYVGESVTHVLHPRPRPAPDPGVAPSLPLEWRVHVGRTRVVAVHPCTVLWTGGDDLDEASRLVGEEVVSRYDLRHLLLDLDLPYAEDDARRMDAVVARLRVCEAAFRRASRRRGHRRLLSLR